MSNSNLASDAGEGWDRDSPSWRGEWAIVSPKGRRALLLTERDSISQGEIDDLGQLLDGNICHLTHALAALVEAASELVGGYEIDLYMDGATIEAVREALKQARAALQKEAKGE